MSGEKCNNWLNGWARVVIILVVAVAAAVAFVWNSQVEQDERIERREVAQNEKIAAHDVSIAVLETRFASIDEKLGDIRSLLRKGQGHASLKDRKGQK